jgi:hypothetical protein
MDLKSLLGSLGLGRLSAGVFVLSASIVGSIVRMTGQNRAPKRPADRPQSGCQRSYGPN